MNGVSSPGPQDAAPDPGGQAATDERHCAAVDDGQLARWIEAVVDHDESALAALYDATVSRLYAQVFRIVGRPQWAEEAVEDAYFQVWRQAARFDPARGKPMSWLLTIARSRALDLLRRETHLPDQPADADAESSIDEEAPGPDDFLEAARRHAGLHRALLSLDAQPRQLLALAYFRGLTQEEIARQTRLPLGTVKTQMRRAMMSLRAVLEPDWVGAEAMR